MKTGLFQRGVDEEMPLALTDHQLQSVLAACQPLAPEKRIVLMERIAAAFKIKGIRKPADADIERALSKGLHGLVQGAA